MIESRSGHSTTERIDDNSKNEQKEKFEKYVNCYRSILMNVAVSIKTLEELTKKSIGVDLFYQYSPAFSQTVVHNFWAQSVIELNECFNGDFCFRNLFNYVNANWNHVFTGEWVRTTNWGNGEIEKETIIYDKDQIFQRIEEAKNILLQNENVILKIKTFRDKVFAHVDKKYPTENLKLQELREIFTVAEKCFNAICSMYNLIHICLEPTNSGDVRNLIKVVDVYNKYRNEIFELERKKIDKEVDEYFVRKGNKK